ncbi:DUF1007 family protein [Pelagibius sp. Alg239-R121]|uniref:DUF1007 family protein n=1 Tax=Pelagibius sp. Alg239-R121 TaxID=2993448 RepID=UPI0024A6A59A|nr:DUF1007 family protein [Pelagibius sp. Alg239-R121]
MVAERNMSFQSRFFPKAMLPAVALAGLLALPSKPAETHPHVWIDVVVKPQFEDGKIVAFAVDWTFDQLYSFLVVDDFDSDKNGTLDDEELESLAKASRDTLGSTGYFIRIMADNDPVQDIEFEKLTASSFLERISYHFTARLKQPLDIRTQNVTFATYDETYYIEITLNQDDPVRFEGDWPRACSYRIGRDEVNKIYFDLVAPTIVSFPCPTS